MTSFAKNSVDALIVHFPNLTNEIVVYTTSDVGTDKLSTSLEPPSEMMIAEISKPTQVR
jgi:hypothetical protein